MRTQLTPAPMLLLKSAAQVNRRLRVSILKQSGALFRHVKRELHECDRTGDFVTVKIF